MNGSFNYDGTFALLTNKVTLTQNDVEVGSHTFATQLNDGNWRHVGITNDGTNCKVYVDGTLDGTINSTFGTFFFKYNKSDFTKE